MAQRHVRAGRCTDRYDGDRDIRRVLPQYNIVGKVE
jgi:hypothetical protein